VSASQSETSEASRQTESVTTTATAPRNESDQRARLRRHFARLRASLHRRRANRPSTTSRQMAADRHAEAFQSHLRQLMESSMRRAVMRGSNSVSAADVVYATRQHGVRERGFR
jgi:branched-subunit amino acid aminotransferase/4-amino-4-deoxychorismate lyase